MSYKGFAKYIYISYGYKSLRKYDFFNVFLWDTTLPDQSWIGAINVDSEGFIYVAGSENLCKYEELKGSPIIKVWEHTYPTEWEGYEVRYIWAFAGDWEGNSYYGFCYREDDSWPYIYKTVIRKLSPAGSVLWSSTPFTSSYGVLTDLTIGAENQICVSYYDSEQGYGEGGKIRAYSSEGSLLWNYTFSDLFEFGRIPLSAIMKDETYHYVVAGPQLYKVENTTILWEADAPVPDFSNSKARYVILDRLDLPIITGGYDIGNIGEKTYVAKYSSEGENLWVRADELNIRDSTFIRRPNVDFANVIYDYPAKVIRRSEGETGGWIPGFGPIDESYIRGVGLSYEQTPAQVYTYEEYLWRNLRPCNVYVNQRGVAVSANVHINE